MILSSYFLMVVGLKRVVVGLKPLAAGALYRDFGENALVRDTALRLPSRS